MGDAGDLPSDDSNCDLPGDVLPGGLSMSQLGEMLQAELMASLRAAKQVLPPAYQEVIELRSVQQLSFKEISRRLNRSADASRKLWCRAVDALQAELLSQNHDISGLQ